MEKIILMDSDEAATFVKNISGWIDRNGYFFGRNETAARYSGCTHRPCKECGQTTDKLWTHCKECREKHAIELYAKKERKEWDGDTPLYSLAQDRFFMTDDSLLDYLDEYQLSVEALRLVICEPVFLRQLDDDYWSDELHEDEELSDAMLLALDQLNKVIRAEKPVSWRAGLCAPELTEFMKFHNG
jgi:hypothetical protein